MKENEMNESKIMMNEVWACTRALIDQAVGINRLLQNALHDANWTRIDRKSMLQQIGTVKVDLGQGTGKTQWAIDRLASHPDSCLIVALPSLRLQLTRNLKEDQWARVFSNGGYGHLLPFKTVMVDCASQFGRSLETLYETAARSPSVRQIILLG